MANYKVREASQPRNYKLTFKEDGFYRTLKRKVVKKLEETKVKPEVKTNVSGLNLELLEVK